MTTTKNVAELMDSEPVERAKKIHRINSYKFKVGDQAEIATRTIAIVDPTGERLVHTDGAFWRYDEATGIHQRLQHEYLVNIIQDMSGSKVTGTDVPLKIYSSTAEGAIALAGARVHVEQFFSKPACGAAFTNGFAKLEKGEIALVAHSPAHRCRSGFPFDYQPGLHSEKFGRHMMVTLIDDADLQRLQEATAWTVILQDKELFARVYDAYLVTQLIQEFVGGARCGISWEYQKGLTLFGDGEGGKGSLIKICRGLFGRDDLVSLPPQKWGQRFAIAQLVGKLANFCDELPEGDIIGSDVFKSTIRGEPVDAEEKHQRGFNFEPKAGHIFATNGLPPTKDLSHGFFRSLIFAGFEKNLSNSKHQRVNAADEILTTELPALAVWALDGAARLQRQKKYTIPPSSQKIHDDWKKQADNVALFVVDCCDVGATEKLDRVETEGWTSGGTLYAQYRQWALTSGHLPVSSTKFGTRMKKCSQIATHRANSGVLYRMAVSLPV